MGTISRNFTAGKMNKMYDERLVPNGEYIDAMNIRMGSTEKSEIGVIENIKGNTPLTALQYIDGTQLSVDAICIGAISDGAREVIYWFVHDPSFTVGATGKLDLIVSFNTLTSTLTYHVISIDDGGGVNTTLNFDPEHVITGVDIIDDLLFFTEDYNPPRFINRRKNYGSPVANIDQFSAESILVIKRPPLIAPSIQTLLTSGQENFMEDRFICFAYRYRYENNEYSATSPFSEPAFLPKSFDFSINSFLNNGMVNAHNTAIITYNTGGSLVKGIDILFKDANGNVIKVIEKLDKADLGLVDNTDYTYTFSNSKIFTILPESEILRLYDNVPRYAKAQTIMGNRLMYGNYVEGYDLVDMFGIPVKLEYYTTLISEEVGSQDLTTTTESGTYTINFAQTIPDAVLKFDLTGVQLIEGAAISVDFTFSHNSFSGDTPFPTETTTDIQLNFTFYLPRDYGSVYDMSSSPEFINAVGTAFNIQTMSNACNGTTFTDNFNCSIPNTLDTLTKFSSGISSGGQPIYIISSPASSVIGFKFPAVRFVDNPVTPTQSVYEYYSVVYSEATYQRIANPKSLHSNRGYEIGIVYEDEFGRSSTALVSPNNTEHVACGKCAYQNKIRITIPPTQIAPYWATRYKFVIKPDAEGYETIYSSIFFQDPSSNNAYFLLEGENARKVEQGDRLIVKADSSGPAQSCVYATVLEKEAKQENFISIPSELDPAVDIPVPSGVYMKMNPSNFSVIMDELSIVSPGQLEVNENNAGEYVLAEYEMNRFDTASSAWVDYDIPAGSRIKMNIKFQRLGTGDGNNSCEKRIYILEKNFVASADYSNMKEWWDGDNVEQVLNDGVQDVGAGGCDVDNSYDSTLASSNTDINEDLCTNYFRFYRYPSVPGTNNNKLVLLVRGTLRCYGVFAKAKRRSTIIMEFQVFRSDTTIIFETEPADASPDIFYENEQSFPIDQVTGDHEGNVQNQDIALGVPAIIDTSFFNCFAFGNGAESYKILDSIVGRWFSLGNRVTSTSAQDYKEADRFSDITYSGIYNNETNVNKLNEFNLGLLNFKQLERSFGPIYILDGRETDVLTLQEDKISYVLAGKNLLSDAAAGGAITSVPEVLGTQIARTENYGISFNPESYVHWGYNRWFTDVKRGSVLQLIGDSYSNEQLRVVSDFGMRTWFRDEFNASFNTQKLGAFDPYMKEYVLSLNDTLIPPPINPSPFDCINCGVIQTINLSEGDEIEYCVNTSSLIGDVTVTYNVIGSTPEDVFEVIGTYNSIETTSGEVTASGSFVIDKNLNTNNTISMKLIASADVTLEVIVSCPDAQELTIISVVVNDDFESGQTIHVENRYTVGAFVGALQSTFVPLLGGISVPIVSLYSSVSGFVGSSSIPPAGSNMRIQTNQIPPDDFDFNPLANKLRYYRSNTLFANTSVDIQSLINASSVATPVTTSGNVDYADFVVPAVGDYLYLIWDLRQPTSAELCYSSISAYDACCNCGDCDGCATYTIGLPDRAPEAEVQYVPCGSITPITVVLYAEDNITICTDGSEPTVISGNPFIEFQNCDCSCESPCSAWDVFTAETNGAINYLDCDTGALIELKLNEGETVTVCGRAYFTPVFISGTGTVLVNTLCGCPA